MIHLHPGSTTRLDDARVTDGSKWTRKKGFKTEREIGIVPVTVEISRGDLVAVAGSKLLAAKDQLDAQLALGFLHFGKDDHLAGSIGSGRARRVADFTAEIRAGRDTHPCVSRKPNQREREMRR